jgi:hypothetical protein
MSGPEQRPPPPKEHRGEKRRGSERGGPRPPFQVARAAPRERHHNTLELLDPFEPSV